MKQPVLKFKCFRDTRVLQKKMLTADLELKYSLEIFVKTLSIAKKLNFNLF